MVFDAIFEEEKSIAQLTKSSWLAAYQYREVASWLSIIIGVPRRLSENSEPTAEKLNLARFPLNPR